MKDTTALTGGEDSPWGKWYQAGREDDSIIYERARRACKEANEDLKLGIFDPSQGSIGRNLVESAPVRVARSPGYSAEMVKAFVDKELGKVNDKRSSKPEWRKKCADLGYVVAGVAMKLKPAIDLLLPHGLEYSIPYGCLMLIFTGSITRRDKKEVVFETMRTLADEVPIFEFYKEMFPTTEMKVTLVSFYIQTLDLLSRLAEYSSLGFLVQLGDAVFARQKYTFTKYTTPIKSTAIKLKSLCDAGHIAEQRSIKQLVESTDSEMKQLNIELQTLLKVHAHELQTLSLHIEKFESDRRVLDHAGTRRQVSQLLDIWEDEIGDIENELERWYKHNFSTAPRDHWTSNGILPCIINWRKLPSNSILWICSEGQGRQSWLTELSLDLIRVCQAQRQMVSFALCDRPRDGNWTPSDILKQLICQLLHLKLGLSSEFPEVFDVRAFRRATSFKTTLRLLSSILGKISPVLFVVDRLDLCHRDSKDSGKHNIAEALSGLVKRFPETLKVIITTGQIVTPMEFPKLAVSIATILTRRRPRRRYEDTQKMIDRRVKVRVIRSRRGIEEPCLG